MVVETGLDVCVNKMAGTINKKMKNKILSLHAAWLFKNGYYDESIDCLNQATDLKRTGVQIMPRAIPCTSSCDPERVASEPLPLQEYVHGNCKGLV